MAIVGYHSILFSIPESFETERLIVRAPEWGDGALLQEAVKESLEQLRPWMPWAKQVPTVEEAEVNVRQARLKYLERTDLRLHLIDKRNGRFVGSSGLHRIDWRARKFEIGYWLRTSCTGQGYMTEAVAAIADFAAGQLQANRIEIRCDSRNIRSARVAERLQFTPEAVLRKETCDPDGILRDTRVFAKVRGVEF